MHDIKNNLMKEDMENENCCCKLKKSKYETFLRTLMRNRKLVIWGASYKSDWFLELCKRGGVEVTGYIDSNPELSQYKDLPVYRPDILKQMECFVFIALENNYAKVRSQLEEYGLKEFQDYIYPSGNTISLTGNVRNYFDLNGNEVSGIIDGFRVELSRGSKLFIGENCKIDKSVIIHLNQNAVLVIGNNSIIESNCRIGVVNAFCQMGDKCHFFNDSNIYSKNAVVRIGDNFSSGARFRLAATQSAVCEIGIDCMFAEDTRIQCSDGHNYWDLKSKENIGEQKKYIVRVGEHVWVGARSSLLYGTDIGDGSMIGLGSFINKKFPKNVAVAGNPARIVRRDVAWARESNFFIQDNDYFEKYSFSNSKFEMDKA